MIHEILVKARQTANENLKQAAESHDETRIKEAGRQLAAMDEITAAVKDTFLKYGLTDIIPFAKEGVVQPEGKIPQDLPQLAPNKEQKG